MEALPCGTLNSHWPQMALHHHNVNGWAGTGAAAVWEVAVVVTLLRGGEGSHEGGPASHPRLVTSTVVLLRGV